MIYLFAGRADAAWSAYQDFLDVEEFSNSAEAMSAENLLDGYCSADPTVVKQRLKQGRCWQALDGPVCSDFSAQLSNALFFPFHVAEMLMWQACCHALPRLVVSDGVAHAT